MLSVVVIKYKFGSRRGGISPALSFSKVHEPMGMNITENINRRYVNGGKCG